jgi:hypothetical protein
MTNHTSVQFWNDLTEVQSEAINGGSRGSKFSKNKIKQVAVIFVIAEKIKGDVELYSYQSANIGNDNDNNN